MNSEIDFVIAWVDGSDINWINEKNRYMVENGHTSEPSLRYRDWGILKYWFRAIEQYAPWVHKIHFVTWGHIPGFLNINHEKIHIVRHEDYIPSEYLPTFSSHTIELNMHRIPGLKEKFVYFNDDMFLNNSVKPTDFFKNGKPRYEALEALVRGNGMFSNIRRNNTELINSQYSKRQVYRKHFFKWFNIAYGKDMLRNLCLMPWGYFPGIVCRHLPSPFLKSTLEEVWEYEYNILNQTSLHKFRTSTDVNQYIFSYWDIMKGNFVPSSKMGQAFHMDACDLDEIISKGIESRCKMICVNDGKIDDDNYGVYKKRLQEAFEHKYTQKSSFEL